MKHFPDLRTPDRSKTVFTFFLVFLAFASQRLELQALAVVFLAYIAISYSHLWATATLGERRAMLIFVLILTLSWPVAQIRNLSAIAHYITVLLSLFCAFVLTRDLHVYLFASRWLLIGALASIGIYLSQTGLEGFPLEEMIPGGSSSNGVTSYLIVAQLNYCLAKFVIHRSPAILTSMLTLFVCYVGYGRASLIAAASLCYITIIFYPKEKYRIPGAVLISIIMYFIYDKNEELIDSLIDATKIGSGLFDWARAAILEEYYNSINFFTFIFGGSYDGTVTAYYFNGNPHNSYIRAHHIFGIFYLVLVIVFPLVLFFGTSISSTLLYPVILLSIFYTRAATETIIFPTMLDLFFFMICFSTYSLSKMRS
ncbi:MAG: hypothetical protein IPM03_15005 [Sulfuritalea sp.]|nr:hypothetical protein [Sulfuritalea sp.]